MADVRISVTPETYLEFQPLSLNPDQADVVISSPNSPSHMSLSVEAVPVLEKLQAGTSLGEVMSEFDIDAETMRDLVKCFADCGLLARIDGRPLPRPGGLFASSDAASPAPGDASTGATPPARRGITLGIARVKPDSLRFFVSPVAIGLYAAAAMFVIAVLLGVPRLRPKVGDWFWSPSLTVSMLGNFLLGWAFVIAHEAAHMVAARRVGLAGTLRIGYRQTFLVAETDVSDIWRVPHRQRYYVYLAGIALECLWMALFLTLFLLEDAGHISLGGMRPLLRALLYARYIGVLWQFRFNMQTDIYYTIGGILNHKNLMEDTKAYLAYLWARVRRRPAREPRLRPKERVVVRLYLVFAAISNAWVWISWAYLIVPVWIRLLWTGGQSVYQGLTGMGALRFLDGFVVIAITLFNWLTPLILMWRSHRRARLAPPAYSVVFAEPGAEAEGGPEAAMEAAVTGTPSDH